MEEIKRIDTRNLFSYSNLTELQKENSKLNINESELGVPILKSYPRRLVLELTNACNLNCIMCGRTHAGFTPHFFNIEWLKLLEPAFRHAEEVTLMGWGEPTIYPKLQEVLEFADSYPVKKYILTNGTYLNQLSPWVFLHNIDIVAVSLDGPDAATNDSIRVGGDFNKIVKDLRELVVRRYFSPSKPHINTVTTLMKRNLDKFPDMITLAAELGIEEVKGVYLTAFSKELENETLFDIPEKVREIFNIASERADKYNIILSLPHIPGEDPTGDAAHKKCYLAWRDLFVGCNGVIRTCMSSENTLMKLPAPDADFKKDFWNAPAYIDFRKRINNGIELMNPACRTCYQSSCANWNKRHSFIQTDLDFYPDWEKTDV